MALPNEKVDIKGARLFPFPFLMLGAAFVLAGFGVLISYPIVSVILIVFGISIVTAFEGTEIYPGSHTYREYNSFLFFRTGGEKRFERIEKIFINSGRVTRRMYTAHTTSSSTFSNTEYNVYVKFSDGVKIFLFSGRSKNRVAQRAEAIARSLNTSLRDYSDKA